MPVAGRLGEFRVGRSITQGSMVDHLTLIDVTGLALEAGLPIDWAETGITTWLKPNPTPHSKSVPVFFTQQLWDRLGSVWPGEAAHRDGAMRVLSEAREALIARIIGQHAWRTWLRVELDAEQYQLWLIVNHGYSEGIAIGFGLGDFW